MGANYKLYFEDKDLGFVNIDDSVLNSGTKTLSSSKISTLLAAKQDKLTFSGTPSSSNPVTTTSALNGALADCVKSLNHSYTNNTYSHYKITLANSQYQTSAFLISSRNSMQTLLSISGGDNGTIGRLIKTYLVLPASNYNTRIYYKTSGLSADIYIATTGYSTMMNITNLNNANSEITFVEQGITSLPDDVTEVENDSYARKTDLAKLTKLTITAGDVDEVVTTGLLPYQNNATNIINGYIQVSSSKSITSSDTLFRVSAKPNTTYRFVLYPFVNNVASTPIPCYIDTNGDVHLNINAQLVSGTIYTLNFSYFSA